MMLKYFFSFLFFFSGLILRAQVEKPVSIYGMVQSKSSLDTIELIYYDNIYGLKGANALPVTDRFKYLPRKGFYQAASFKFDLNHVRRPGYISIKYGNKYFLHHYLIMPGDSIQLFFDLEKNQTVFSGPSAVAFKCQYEIQGAEITQKFETGVTLVTGDIDAFLNKNNYRYLYQKDKEEFGSFGKVSKMVTMSSDFYIKKVSNNLTESPVNNLLDVLNSYKKRIDPERYAILKADIIGKIYAPIIKEFTNRLYLKTKSKNDITELKKHEDFYFQYIKPLSINHIPDELKIYSAYYSDYLVEMAIIKSEAELKMPVFKYLISAYNGELRDKLLGKFIFDYYKQMPTGEKMIKEAIKLVKVPEIYEKLKFLNDHQSKGSAAYNFRLQNDKGQWVEMADLKGKLVLMDFWFTGCVPCIWLNQKTLKPVKQHFKDRDDFIIVSISIDQEYEKWIKSVKEGQYTSDGSINLYTMGKGSDHEIIRYYDIHAFPSLILFDKEGKLLQTSGLKSSVDELINILEEHLSEK